MHRVLEGLSYLFPYLLAGVLLVLIAFANSGCATAGAESAGRSGLGSKKWTAIQAALMTCLVGCFSKATGER
jgi:fructose-specific phosphotransferase system IIC component